MPWGPMRAQGAWAPLSARYYFDDAIAEAGEAAELLYLRGLAYCADAPTDGFITERQVATIVGLGLPDVEERAKALVRVGLWVHEGDRRGYMVRSWLKWNRSHDERQAHRARDAARKRGDRQRPEGHPSGVRTESVPIAEQNIAEQSTVLPDPDGSGKDWAGADAPDPAAPDRRPVPAPPAIADLRRVLATKRAKGAR